MIGKPVNQDQKHLFLPELNEFINPKHELSLLADKIDWDFFESEFAPLYSETGAPAKPIRLMVGLLILKQIYDLGDETVMAEWVSNPYYQYFCGEAVFQWKFPCDPSDLVHFRKRIGESGVEKILGQSILIHGEKVLKEDVSIDTTVQEKNITYPTDTKLAKKIIDKSAEIARSEGIKQRQSYKFVSKDLVRASNARSPRGFKKAKKARKKIKTIAGRVVRELRRKLGSESLAKHKDKIEIYERILEQKRGDRNKIYSLHALEVACIAKGKAHKKYEFGSKVSLATTQKSNVIMAAVNFRGNPNDTKTLEKTLEQQERMTGVRPRRAYVDRGYKRKKVGETRIHAPDNGVGKSRYEKAKARKSFRRRAAIEPIIGHTKDDHGMRRNYLKGEVGDAINAMLAASAFNFKSWMRKEVKKLIFVLIYLKAKWHQLSNQSKLMPSF
jgi:IS5 family transposase